MHPAESYAGLGARPPHHAVVIVRDLDASLRFYRDWIGLDPLQL